MHLHSQNQGRGTIMKNSKIKFIAVNGGRLVVPLTKDFLDDFLKFYEFIQAEGRKCIDRSNRNGGENVDCTESCKRIMTRFDDLFGKEACKRTFGEGIVGFDALEEFMIKFCELAKTWEWS